jgi:hypothetical protein
LDSLLQKASIGVDPHYLDVWQPTHQGNESTTEKRVSIVFTLMYHLLYLY